MPRFTCCLARTHSVVIFRACTDCPYAIDLMSMFQGPYFYVFQNGHSYFSVQGFAGSLFSRLEVLSRFIVQRYFFVANPTFYICFRGRKIPWIFLCNYFQLLSKLVRAIFCRDALLFNSQDLFRASFEGVINQGVVLGCLDQPLVFLVAIEMHAQV